MSARPVSESKLGPATVALLDRLARGCAELELPAPPPVLAQLRERVASAAFRVLVVGEVKRGKSTFVNALIGAQVLPHDVDVATSQVFRVRHAADEAYRLRFEDGTAREIGRDDLARYGSQVVADEGEGAVAEADLRWIEVERPAPFLPERVELLDCPGAGARYAAHAEVTRRFVPLADAVVFVLDSSRPIDRLETQLLAAILAVTSRVFFVQTKIDQHTSEIWEGVRARNEEILRAEFGDALAEPRVWPLSSTNLLAAAGSPDAEALLFVSHYPELADALRRFLDEVCGSPRAAQALGIADRHHAACRHALEQRLHNVTEEFEREARAHRASVDRRKSEFRASWGRDGRERAGLREAIARSGAVTRQAFREALEPGGSIGTGLAERIDAVETADDATRVGQTLAADVVAFAMDEWARVCSLHQSRCSELLQPFLHATEELAAGSDDEPVQLRAARFRDPDDHLYDRVRGTVSYSMPMWAASSIVISLVASPLAIAAAAGGVLWALSRGWRVSSQAKGKAGRSELHKHLRDVLSQVSRHYFGADVARSRSSRVDEYLRAVQAAVEARIDAVAKQREDEARRELVLLDGQANLRAADRERAAQGHRAALADWDELGRNIAELLETDQVQMHHGDLTG